MIPSQPRTTAPRQEKQPTPTNGSENNRVVLFFISATTVILFIVLGFNFLGPEGASRSGIADGPATSSSGRTTTGGPSVSESPGHEGRVGVHSTRNASGGSAGNDPQTLSGAASSTGDLDKPRATSAPQAPDSRTPAGREGVGAPRGGSPDAAIPSGGAAQASPSRAITPASATPAAPTPSASR